MGNPIAERAREIRQAKFPLNSQLVLSFRLWLQAQAPEDLLRWMRELSHSEWKVLWGAGVPGSVYPQAMAMYGPLRERMERQSKERAEGLA